MWLWVLVLLASRWADGAPLPYSAPDASAGPPPELMVALSVAALVVLVVVVINCATCCKEQVIDFKEFEDNFEDELDFTPPAEDTPSVRSPAEVYTLAVSPLPLPCPPHLQPPRNTEDSASCQVVRHNLSYLQEVGSGWFGKVLLSEMYTEPGVAQVLVQELKANAGAQEQSRFLQKGDPYRILQHPNLLQCLGQCVEAIPFLLVFEYCELGDLRSYLAHQDGEMEKQQVQKMACEIAAGVAYLHKHDFLHSDLALRNCFLSTDLTVKVGDYGTGSLIYKEDYITTEAATEVPLRWMAPELIGELHGDVVASEQTKPGNVWALGITLWELFESGARPYPYLSDMEVLVHVIKERRVTLPKPQLELPHSDRWYEVLQFCWLALDKRATAEEVHRLLTYLRMQAQRRSEEDFEQRWDALRPNPPVRQTTLGHSSFPILEPFGEEVLSREVDEVLTVTETSRGLSFEYVWETAKRDHYNAGGGLPVDAASAYHSMFFPTPGFEPETGLLQSKPEKDADTAAPPGVPGVLPVFDAHKAATGNEYYIQLEEQEGHLLETGGDLVELNGAPDNGTAPGKQQIVVLRDIPLDESSTDVDFFHRSIDSKDSYLQENHAWSSSDQESPYHSNIFTEGGSRMNDSGTWSKGLLEMPQLNGRESSLEDTCQNLERSSSLLGDNHEEAALEGMELENPGIKHFLNTDKLADNFLFLKEKSLLKEGPSLLEELDLLCEGSMGADLAGVLSTGGGLRSGDTLEGLASGPFGGPGECGVASASEKEEHLNSSATVMGILEPFKSNETLVPLSPLVTEKNHSDQPHVGNGSPTGDVPLHSTGSGMVSCSDSTSVSTEVVFSPINGHYSTEDFLHGGAKSSALVASLGASPEDEPPAEMKDLAELPSLASSPAHMSKTVVDNGLTSRSVSSTMADVKNSLNIVLSELPRAEDSHPESLVSPVPNDSSSDVSSFLTSDACLDKVSQDSLLDSTVSTPLSAAELSTETPDSWDSTDPRKLQPPHKAVDSGYETENLESPEWTCQPVCPSPVLQAGLPAIVISEVEAEAEPLGEGTDIESAPSPRASATPAAGKLLPGGSQTCRDSAYFSDNECEADRKPEDVTAGNSAADGTPWSTGSLVDVGNQASGGHNVAGGFMQGFETEGPMTWLRKEVPELVLSAEENWDRVMKVVIDGREDEGKLVVPPQPGAGPEEPASVLEDPAEVEPPSALGWPPADQAVQAKLVRVGGGPKLKEPDVEGRYLGKLDSVVPAGVLGDGLDADEENEEDENSEDSDDDMRADHLHSSESESEDDVEPPVPVVIMDTSDSRSLKSLLKISSPAELLMSPGNNSSPTKKSISFFDDVTVYLFDQETPTRELGKPAMCSSSMAHYRSAATGGFLARSLSEGSTDEEGGGFEWDDDFSSDSSFASKATGNLAISRPPAGLFSSPPTRRASPYAVSAPEHRHEPSWASRFSISPASIASFSLTHLTDSDTEQGGSSEDGEKD